ncbi:hypothetical protein GCM10010869_73160 [Mesorhizobium tianshanense]|uniref:Reverse transcriptase domain-containing protein n=1 Tax=Mesorhizobium tianshanense TaxID=39844 RepID=A0A562MW27_9HYPH|nr:RNA-directed DNA polymerase [Mesorhizobium tianshanense]TWI24115.1 hypothetical protein IQ26_06339 [Mesorhizobium tianshanense]GLS41719.1 hypothetical protein GCM10010869_73160 [Mesorhizobium tianshanense]
MNAYERLLLPENLNYAWQKAKRLYRMADGFVDNGELAEFELDLERQLKLIFRQFETGRYRLKKLRPLPRPKKMKGETPIDRQFFHVAVQDQVAWIAVANALGPELDGLMPSWSYGNRIYRPAWYEEDEHQRSRLEIGPYRHASGHLYRKFQHSWPLFRRHVALTARAMVRGKPLDRNDLDNADQLATASAEKEGLPYLRAEFWQRDARAGKGTDLYHASIDLKQFYPSIRSGAVLRGLTAASGAVDDDDPMRAIVEHMLRFQLDKSEMQTDTLENVEPRFGNRKVDGIPTGLFVAGFLANAAMLPIDAQVNARVEKERSLAHFRFVDDHTIIAYDFDQLCNWIAWYQELLVQHDIGAEVNNEKYDPESLCSWMSARAKSRSAAAPLSRQDQRKKEEAVRDTKMDGANPTKLLTKTLGQVSALAATNIDILDDDDLRERLKLLEWLLLADIPEREIRPDTRATFAAGQIAALAPILIQEGDGLIDEARALAHLKSRAPKTGRSSRAESAAYRREVAEKEKLVGELNSRHKQSEDRHLRHCFELLLQAFREYPGKARLFYRLHQYCRLTGHRGLQKIADSIQDMRTQRKIAWADYYAGLSLQILADGVLHAGRTIAAVDSLRSDKEAAYRHLEDVAALSAGVFSVPQAREAWFHSVGRREFGTSLLSVAELIEAEDRLLGAKLRRLAAKNVGVTFEDASKDWKGETGRLPGVWAHRAESILSIDAKPSAVWRKFESCFSYRKIADRRAARRYPEHLSNSGWTYFLQSERSMKETDSGWIREAMMGKPRRIETARSSRKTAFRRAVRSFTELTVDWITLSEWTHFARTECSPFDPRAGEWTALEIIRQIVSPIVEDIAGSQARLDNLHPNNVLVSKAWISDYLADRGSAALSWEEWRSFARAKQTGMAPVRLRGSATSIFDYRYFIDTQDGRTLDPWERRLTAVGRLLLGMLRFDHAAPRLWNLRGNEQVVMLPRSKMFESLAISSLTLLLMEGCLSGRSAETRAISRRPGLFGWEVGVGANDAGFDPPLLIGPNQLLNAVKRAQRVLVDNQLAVAMNQPRQLIPFRLNDFAAGPDGDGEESELGE